MKTDFNNAASTWDLNPIHTERTKAIALKLKEMVHLNKEWKGLEFGAGTALLSFAISANLNHITLVDSSEEMLKICEQKITESNANHISTLHSNIEQDGLNGCYDIIYSQMALHHIIDPQKLISKLYSNINTNGYFVVADLYTEDGSFHGDGVDVHNGFDPNEIKKWMEESGFKDIEHAHCYTIKKENNKEYPIFILVGKKV